MRKVVNALHAKGVIGMNTRNIRYIGRYNDRRLYPLVDDKLQTKLLATEHGVITPALIGTVRSQFEVRHIAKMVAECPGFVIKPAKGSSGKGILVIERVEGDEYVKPSGTRISRKDVERHLSNILSGLYSWRGPPDAPRTKTLTNSDERFPNTTQEGLPDIQVIASTGNPLRSMMRLPTAASKGKANCTRALLASVWT